MIRYPRIRPLLTAMHRYEKTVSTRDRGHGQYIDAPIMAYLIETPNGRILVDTGCDYKKIVDSSLRARYLEPMRPTFEPPVMTDDQRIPAYLERLGITPLDLDVVFLTHLHFDHAGGCTDLPGCETHVQHRELECAQTGEVNGVFADEIATTSTWCIKNGAYEISPGVNAIETPGHTAGHMSVFIELHHGRPVILCGDAADLTENLTDEIAPGYCWRDDVSRARQSIRDLKDRAHQDGATLWPNHDLDFYRDLPAFPDFVS